MTKKRLPSAIQKFIAIESFSGILLFGATILALVWANSPLGHIYESIWGYELGVKITDYKLQKPLILWINDGLMAIFFFLIGLEIKRELMVGELNTMKKATFPLIAAIGGIALPALIFVFLNKSPETLDGWAIPMATDIAFSLAILKVLGKRIPLNVKIFLTAFAIVDDLGAVMIIALFYSSGIKLTLIGYALVLLAILYFLTYRGLFSKYLLLIFGIIIWVLFLKAGIHPTIAGVLLAFAIPIRRKVKLATFTASLDELSQQIKASTIKSPDILTKEQMNYIEEVDNWTYRVQSPLQRYEHKLHDWVAYVIMPIFALSNAGVVINTTVSMDYGLIVAIALALIVGKSVGIFSMAMLAVKTGLSKLPEGVNTMQVLGVSFLAGVGFTMSIFIANLAFRDDATLLDSAKIGILIGSLVSGLIGYLILAASSKKKIEIEE